MRIHFVTYFTGAPYRVVATQTIPRSVDAFLRLAERAGKFILVDYNDTTSTAAELQHQYQCIQLLMVPGRQHWFAAHARNVALRYLQAIEASADDLVMLFDIDNVMTPEVVIAAVRAKQPNNYVVGPATDDYAGYLVATLGDLSEVNGYEEALSGNYQFDIEMRYQLQFLGRQLVVTACTPDVIPTGERDLAKRGANGAGNIEIAKIYRQRHPYRANIGRDWGLGGYALQPIQVGVKS